MSSEPKRYEQIRGYFSDEEWNSLSNYVKNRYANIKENYQVMVQLGFSPPLPEFMRKKETAPEKDKKKAKPRTSTAANKGGRNRVQTERSGEPIQPRYPKRERKPVCYMEGPVYSDDHYIFCDECNEEHPGDCPVYGPLEFIQDTPVPAGDPERANKTLPDSLVLGRSSLKGAQYGIFTMDILPKRVCFGPYEGVRVDKSQGNGYTWQIRKRGRCFLVDARPLSDSNWMRYVNCAPSEEQQNLIAFQYKGAIYYRTCRHIPPGEELLVFYGREFARELGIRVHEESNLPQEKEETGDTFRCGDCDSVFTSRDYLEKHRKHQHVRRGGRHQCCYCDYSSDNKGNVVAHERIHRGEKPFLCHLCGKGFSRKGDLKRHQRTHSGDRPYECDTCGQRFTLMHHLESHRRTHSGERLFSCPECGKTFSERSALKKHRLLHTGVKPHSCEVCGRTFARLGAMKRHVIAVHTKDYPHKCTSCEAGFCSPSELRKHLATKHNDPQEE